MCLTMLDDKWLSGILQYVRVVFLSREKSHPISIDTLYLVLNNSIPLLPS